MIERGESKKNKEIPPEATIREVPDPPSLHAALKAMREERGLVVMDLSRATGLAPLDYYARERGKEVNGKRVEPKVSEVDDLLAVYTATLHLNTGEKSLDVRIAPDGIVTQLSKAYVRREGTEEFPEEEDPKIAEVMIVAKSIRSKVEIRPKIAPETGTHTIRTPESFQTFLKTRRAERGLPELAVSNVAGVSEEEYLVAETGRKKDGTPGKTRLSDAVKIVDVYDAEFHIETGKWGDSPRDVRPQLRYAREDIGMSQEAVGEKLNTSQSTISTIDTKEVDPTMDIVTNYANAIRARLQIRPRSQSQE